jgi:hypothetical protein
MFRTREEYSAVIAGRMREFAELQTRNAAARLHEARLLRVGEALSLVIAQNTDLFATAADVPSAAAAAVRILERA